MLLALATHRHQQGFNNAALHSVMPQKTLKLSEVTQFYGTANNWTALNLTFTNFRASNKGRYTK